MHRPVQGLNTVCHKICWPTGFEILDLHVLLPKPSRHPALGPDLFICILILKYDEEAIVGVSTSEGPDTITVKSAGGIG